jgi:hypothetical protein
MQFELPRSARLLVLDLATGRPPPLHQQGRTWAEIARFVGQRKLSITADTYTHVMADGREAALAALLAA